MRKRKLYHLLKLLSVQDQERFTLYLASPYFNSSQTLIEFWEHWQQKVLAQEGEEEVSEEEFVEGSAIKVSRIDALCWELMVKARNFFSLQSFEESQELGPVMFMRALLSRDHGLDEFPRFGPQAEKELESLPESTEKYLAIILNQSEISRARISARIMDAGWQREFAAMQESLERFSLIKRLQWKCGALNATQIFRQDDAVPDPEFFEQNIPANISEDQNILAKLYLHCLFLMLRGDEDGNIRKILDILDQRRDEIAEDIRNDVVNYVLNYCIRQINLGNEAYLEHTFELYRVLIKFGDLLSNGQISPQQFKNTVALACRVSNTDWAREFIDTYHPLLSDQHDGMALDYNNAVLLFHQARYDAAIQLLKHIIQQSADDIFYGLDARIYLWKSYFEHLDQLQADELDEMFRLYDSFRLYVSRNDKISPRHKQQYRNFVRLFKRFMVCLEEPGPRAPLEELLGELESSEGVANLTWFMKKVKEALEKC